MLKLEIQAYSLEDAKIQAYKKGITVVYEATKSWKQIGAPILDKEIKIYAADFLENHNLFDFEGAGMIITISPGTDNTRKKPFLIKNNIRKGRCKLKRFIEIYRKDNNQLLSTANNKTEAIALAKESINNWKTDIYAKTVYKTNDIDFSMKYVPSSNTKLGQYIVFGVENNDVKLSKRKNRLL